MCIMQVPNSDSSWVLQCYLKDAAARIETDMQRAALEGWKFGAKTVRGAYMVVERARAAEKGYDSPIWDSLQETHDNYNRCVAPPSCIHPSSTKQFDDSVGPFWPAT